MDFLKKRIEAVADTVSEKVEIATNAITESASTVVERSAPRRHVVTRKGTLNKSEVNAAVDDFISKFAKQFDLPLDKAVEAILETSTISGVLAKQSSSMGLIKQGNADPVKARQLANSKAADENIGKMSRADFVAKLIEELKTFANIPTLEQAAKKSTMAHWLYNLPVSSLATEVNLPYSDAMMSTTYMRLQEKIKELLGSVVPEYKSFYNDLLAETKESISESVGKRLKTVDPGAIEGETKKMMAEFTERCTITPKTEWVVAMHTKKVPLNICIEFLVAMFIYSVDQKWCDCQSMKECKGKPKGHRTKPPKPELPSVHGYNIAPWAVANWVNRLKGGNSLLPREQDLLGRTINLMQPFVGMLDRALDCLPPVGMRAVFRGVPVRLSDQFGANDDFIMEPHTSTSLEGEEALTFMDPKKPGTFFVLRLHSAGMIDFMSAYPHQAEALLAMNSSFTVASKLSRTVLRMLGCRFDVITLAEGGSRASDSELMDFLIRTARQTQFIYREYLNDMIPVRISEDKGKTSFLLDYVKKNAADKKKHQHVLITGVAGCGKTSATLSTYSHLVQQNGCYAVMVPLPSVKKFGTDSDVDNALLEALDVSAGCFAALCKAYKVYVILDSLDEVGDLTTSVVKKGILPRNKLLQSTTVILSCRGELFDTLSIKQKHIPIVGDGAANSVDVWSIAPFNQDDSREMIKRYAMRKANLDEGALVKHANCAPKELQSHPLYLQMILQIPAGTLKSGASRTDIYKAFIDNMIDEAYPEDDRKDAMERLQKFALNEMLLKEVWQSTVYKAREYLNCSGSVLELLPFRVDDPHDVDAQLGFLHRSQAEYLAAMELSREPNKLKKKTTTIAATAKLGTFNFMVESEDEAAKEAAIKELLFGCGEGVSMIATLEEMAKQKEAEFGADSIEHAKVLQNLGTAYGAKGDNNKRLEVLERALKIKEKKYGSDHIEIAVTLQNLGLAYSAKGDKQKYLELSERSLAIKEKKYGKDSIELATLLSNIGLAYNSKGEYKKFLELLTRAVELKEKHYGPDHFELATTLMNLGLAYKANGDNKKKIELTERSLKLKQKHYGPDHIEVAQAMMNLGLAYGDDGDKEKSLELTLRSLELKEKHYGSDHIELAICLSNLGLAYGRNGNNDKKIEHTSRALKIKEKHYGSEHPELAQTQLNLAGALKEKDPKRAMELVERAMTLTTKHLGRTHVTTIKRLNNSAIPIAKTTGRKDKLEEYKKWAEEGKK